MDVFCLTCGVLPGTLERRAQRANPNTLARRDAGAVIV